MTSYISDYQIPGFIQTYAGQVKPAYSNTFDNAAGGIVQGYTNKAQNAANIRTKNANFYATEWQKIASDTANKSGITVEQYQIDLTLRATEITGGIDKEETLFNIDIINIQETGLMELDGLVGMMTNLFEKDLSSIMDDLVSSIGNVAAGIIQGALDAISNLVENFQAQLISAIINFKNQLISNIKKIFNVFAGAIQGMINTVLGPINNAFQKLSDITDYLAGMINFFDRISGMVNIARQAQVKVPDGFGGFKFNPKYLLGSMDMEALLKIPITMQKPDIVITVKWKKNPIAKYVSWTPAQFPIIKIKLIMPFLM